MKPKEFNLKWKPAGQPGALIYRAGRLFVRVGEPRFAALGVAHGQFPVFAALNNGNQFSQKDLAQFAQIEQPTMAQTLARMERDGLVQRTPDPKDKRSSLMSLTPVASTKIPLLMEALMQGNEDALIGFTPAEKEMLIDLLKRVIANLETATQSRS